MSIIPSHIEEKDGNKPKLSIAALHREIATLKKEISEIQAERNTTRTLLASAETLHKAGVLPEGVSVPELRQQVEQQSARLQTRYRELADLEGIIERRAVRKWRMVNFIAGLGVGSFFSAYLQQLFLGP